MLRRDHIPPSAGVQEFLRDFDDNAALLDLDEHAARLDLEHLGGLEEPLAGVSYAGSFASAVSLGAATRVFERLPDLGLLPDAFVAEPSGTRAAFVTPTLAAAQALPSDASF